MNRGILDEQFLLRSIARFYHHSIVAGNESSAAYAGDQQLH